jgi:DNA-binding transcriptional MocR family regulator
MSVQAISAALAVRDVSSSAKFLLMVLANYADQEMKCWPSQARLSEDMCMSARTMVKLFHELEAKGLIVRYPRARRKDGSRTSQLTVLAIHSAESAPRTLPIVKSTTEPTCNPAQNQRAESAPKPSIEPSIEPSVRARPLVPVESQAARAKRQAEMAQSLRQLASQLGERK